MKSEDLFKAIGTCDSEFFEHSEIEVKPNRKSTLIRCLGLAACLCIIMTAVFLKPHINPAPQSPGNDDTSRRWIITYNKATDMRDTSNTKHDFCRFGEELDENELLAVGPGTDFEWMDYTGYKTFYGSGDLINVIINITNTEWGGTTTVTMQKGKVVTDYLLPDTPIVSDFNGTKVTAYEYDAEDHVMLELTFEINGIGFLLSTDVQPGNIEKAKSDIYDILECYIVNKNIDISSIKVSNIPEWTSKELTFSEALQDETFGKYMPSGVPNGFTPENIQRYKDQKSDFLIGIWTQGYNDLRWKISYLGDDGRNKITSVNDKRNYDLSLYPSPRADSVPDELQEIVDSPIFRIEELTLDTVKARTCTVDDAGDTSTYSMHFSVLYGNVVVEVSSKGISPEWIYDQLKSIAY